MQYSLIPITLLACLGSALVALRDLRQHPLGKEGEEKLPKSAIIYAVVMLAVTLGVSVLFCVVYGENSLLENAKRMALLSVLWPVGYIDLKSYRIPNSLILLGLCYWGILLGCDGLFASKTLVERLISEGVAAAALLLAAGLCALFLKGSIGFGDMKLLTVMGLFLALEGIWSAIFVSLVISFIIAVVLLVTKRKTRKDAIPFGPALVLGTYLSVCLAGV